jgi:hypothetical protein
MPHRNCRTGRKPCVQGIGGASDATAGGGVAAGQWRCRGTASGVGPEAAQPEQGNASPNYIIFRPVQPDVLMAVSPAGEVHHNSHSSLQLAK